MDARLCYSDSGSVTVKRKSTKPYLTPSEAAELLMVSPVTVRQWARKGLLPAETTAGGHRRFLRQDIERFARRRGLALSLRDEGSLRILIVEDDRDVAESLAALVEAAPQATEVQIAHDGFDAGRKVHAFQPHIMLLDLVMEGLDGYEVCSRLKADPTTKATRVIAMTGYHTPRNEARILECGAEVCLAKPLAAEEILERLGLGSAE